MFFRQIYDTRLAQAAYLIGCQRTGEAIVIDPERDVDRYIDLARVNGLRVVAVAETHVHADFLSGARELAERTGATVYVSGMGGPDWSSRWLQSKASGGAYAHQLLQEGATFRVGQIDFVAMHTPGHTPEHVSYIVVDRGGGANEAMGIVTGDFVFVGDLGRPDLLESAAGIGGSARIAAHQLWQSATRFISDLPDWMQVWPAHGAGSACGKALGAVPQSTVGYEKRFNPALRAAVSEHGFVDFILDGQPEPPTYFARMKYANRDGPALLGALPTPRPIETSGDLAAAARTMQVLDARPWPEFRAGHLPGSLFTPLDANFATIAGSYADPGRDVLLVCNGAQLDECVRCLVRVGIDRVVAWTTPAVVGKTSGLVPSGETDVATVRRMIDADSIFVLDVRRSGEFAEGHIDGAVNIAHTRLADRLADLPRNQPIVCHCKAGGRSAYATALLQREGFNVINLAGGFDAWLKDGAPVLT
ncbi:MAG: rhodanese-like domain-containing protein [Phycisphaerae bacterium]|nr:rhodanese-like domain-containing protein [Phycisphaerae bacterium]